MRFLTYSFAIILIVSCSETSNDNSNQESSEQPEQEIVNTENVVDSNQLDDEIEDENGLTELDRKNIYVDIIKSERRADEDAQAEYCIDISLPCYQKENVDKYMELNAELLVKYHAEVFEKYDISEDVMYEISAEAFEKEWHVYTSHLYE